MRQATFVYFMRMVSGVGPVKIGCSENPAMRLSTYGTWSPYPLEIVAQIPGSRELEWNIHDCFFDLHSHREWFHPSPRIATVIDKLKAGVAIEQAMDLADIRGCVRSKIAARRWAARRGEAA